MARQRFIWPNIWDDPQLGKCSDTERILYVCCFSSADDEGRLVGDPAHLRSTAFAFRPRMSHRIVTKAIANLQRACSQFHVYEVASVQYVQFLNWLEWQRPKYPSPSKLPPPPGYVLVDKRWIPGIFPQSSRNDGETLAEGSSTGRDGMGWVEKDTRAVTSKEDVARASVTSSTDPDWQPPDEPAAGAETNGPRTAHELVQRTAAALRSP
jgi:hypothetical protein